MSTCTSVVLSVVAFSLLHTMSSTLHNIGPYFSSCLGFSSCTMYLHHIYVFDHALLCMVQLSVHLSLQCNMFTSVFVVEITMQCNALYSVHSLQQRQGIWLIISLSGYTWSSNSQFSSVMCSLDQVLYAQLNAIFTSDQRVVLFTFRLQFVSTRTQ